MRPVRVVAADEREAREVEPDRPSTRALADHDVEAEVLHGGIEALLDDAREAVHLVDEQDVAVVEVREDRGEVAGPFECGATRRVEAGPHLVGDDPGEARLAEAGRTREQHVVDGLPALFGRGQHDLEVLAQAGLADELPEVPRAQRGLFRDLRLVGLGTQQLFSHLRPARSRSASRKSSSTVPSSPSWPNTSRTSSLPYPRPTSAVAHLGPRVRCGAPGDRGEIDIGHLEPGLQVDEKALRGALADTGHRDERIEVVLGQAAAEAGRRMHREDRERELRADAARGDQRLERVAFVAREKSVQHQCVVAHVLMGEQENVGTGFEPGDRADRNQDAIADARDLDEHLAASRCARARTPATSRSRLADRARAVRRGSDRACAPGRGDKTPARARRRHPQASGSRANDSRRVTIVCTASLSARPSPVTASFTSLGLYCTTGIPARAAATSARPLAWPTEIAVRALFWNRTRSTARADGRSCRHEARPVRRRPRGAARAADHSARSGSRRRRWRAGDRRRARPRP